MLSYAGFDPAALAVNFPSSPPTNYILGTSPVDSIRTPGTTAFSDFNDFNNNNNNNNNVNNNVNSNINNNK